MTFTLYVEHQVIGGEKVVEDFEGVESFNDPPMTNSLHLTFADDRDTEKLSYGNIVRGKEEPNND